MTPEWLAAWRDSVLATFPALLDTFEERHGFPPDEHTLGPPAGVDDLDRLAGLDLPAPLVEMCRVVGGTSLPDVGNGCFVSSPRTLLLRRGPVLRLGSDGERVVQFGSDGGGRLYVLPLDAVGPVRRLEGCALGGDTVTGGRIEQVADDLQHFLERLLDAVRTFVVDGDLVDL